MVPEKVAIVCQTDLELGAQIEQLQGHARAAANRNSFNLLAAPADIDIQAMQIELEKLMMMHLHLYGLQMSWRRC